MRQSAYFFVAVCVMLAGGCAHSSRQTARNSPTNDDPRGPVIVRLVGQHQTVTVTSGPDGPLYTAEDANGKMIVANASLAELREGHPEVYQFIEPSFAAESSVNPGATPARSSFRGTTGISRDVFIRAEQDQ
jgi:hypothetical protein